MKKLVFLFFAFAVMQVSAQKLSSSENNASSNRSTVENLAANQLKDLTQILDLNEKQQSQVSLFIVNQLKSNKFQNLVSGIGSDKATGQDDEIEQTGEIGAALLLDDSFQKEINSVLNEKQKLALIRYTPQ